MENLTSQNQVTQNDASHNQTRSAPRHRYIRLRDEELNNLETPLLRDVSRSSFWETQQTMESFASSITSSEAITVQRKNIKQEYLRLVNETVFGDRIISLLPTKYDDTLIFKECYHYVDDFLDEVLSHENKKFDTKNKNEEKPDALESQLLKFRFDTAKLALRLIGGDTEISGHYISNNESYREYSYPNMPQIWQLFVLMCQLAKLDARDFILSYLVEKCDTPSAFLKWKQPFVQSGQFLEILSYDDLGMALGADRQKGSPFVTCLVELISGSDILPGRFANKRVHHMLKAYTEKRTHQIMPLIETLFMIMRGHNDQLLDQNERNRPACAEGAYLGFLKSVVEQVSGYEFSLSIIAIEGCD